VEVLNIDMITLTAHAVENLREAMETPYPLALLWKKTKQTDGNAIAVQRTHREIVVPRGSTVRVYGDNPGSSLMNWTVPTDWSGVVVHDDSAKATVDALLYGIGFCEVERTLLANKRQRVDSQVVRSIAGVPTKATNIRTLFLEVDRRVSAASCGVDALLEMLGAPLNALSINDSVLDDAKLKACLGMCPHLHSLRLATGTVPPAQESQASLYVPPGTPPRGPAQRGPLVTPPPRLKQNGRRSG
jgi:hypothetical protein